VRSAANPSAANLMESMSSAVRMASRNRSFDLDVNVTLSLFNLPPMIAEVARWNHDGRLRELREVSGEVGESA